jgi:glycosyltransferase involved in cell wall biosynthesis
MLGWEFPPHLTGGLGSACLGLTRALDQAGVDVTFVVPRAFGDEPPGPRRLVGLTPASGRSAGDQEAACTAGRAPERVKKLRVLALPSGLRPYESARVYAERTQRAASASAPCIAPAFEGGYGANLFAEVERFAAAVAELAQRSNFDLVHGHDWMTFPAALAVGRAARRPVVLHVHATEFDRSGAAADPRIAAIERSGLRAADRVVCVSRTTARQVSRAYGVSRQRLRVVHNGTSELGPRQAPRPRPHPGERLVLFLGRVTRQKGPEPFLEAAALVHAADPSVRFVVAGDGDLLRPMIERAAALGLARCTSFTGFLAPAEVERVFERADLFVLPSISEPFGLTPLEALARGVPALVARTSGVAEVLRSCVRIDAWNPADIAAKILTLLRQPQLRAELARTGLQELARLSWERSAQALLSTYHELLR